MRQVDFLIVGQGIAGTLFAWFLEKSGQSFHIIDKGHHHSSTKIAAGLINPITGRRFVKSWMIEDLLPFAKQTYQEIEQQTGLALWKEIEIVRYFQSTAEGNNWLTKTNYDGYRQYLSKGDLAEDLGKVIFDTGGYGIINGAKVRVDKLIHSFQEHYLKTDQLTLQEFDYQQLVIAEEGIQYQDIHANKVIFCEGFAANQNPWFASLPYESAKGEVLILKIPTLRTQYVLKKNQFIVPLENDLFWFGSNYEWEDLTNQPTQSGKAQLEDRLRDILQLEYEIVDHVAAVRPVLKDRRPVVGMHPNNPRIGIFNGLGTKGTSIAPFWAKALVTHLVEGAALNKEVVVDRFF